MNKAIPLQLEVQLVKVDWFKRSYRLVADGRDIGGLDYAKSYLNNAIGVVEGKEFSIRRRGWWKHFIDISSTTHQPYNMHIDLNWRNKLKILDAAGNSYTFKQASIWKNKWHWVDRYERPVIEIKSKSLSRKSRGLIEVKDPVMKDCLFWIIVSWFVIMCAESDAGAAAAT